MERPERAAAALGAQPRANGCSGAAHGALRNGYVRGLPAPDTQVCAAGALGRPGGAGTGAGGAGRPSRGLRRRAGLVGPAAARPRRFLPGERRLGASGCCRPAASSRCASRRCSPGWAGEPGEPAAAPHAGAPASRRGVVVREFGRTSRADGGRVCALPRPSPGVGRGQCLGHGPASEGCWAFARQAGERLPVKRLALESLLYLYCKAFVSSRASNLNLAVLS